MDFKETITNLSTKVINERNYVRTEEATKTAFILPFITALGYDIFNPCEVVPEMDCDLTKRGDKIDYAIQKNGNTIILIECKHCSSNLNLHDTQLAKYYAASNARFGVLTNGIEYRFYTDINKSNIMDDEPFLIVDISNINDNQIEAIKMFCKACYDESLVFKSAKEIKYYSLIKQTIENEMTCPSEDMVTLLLDKCNIKPSGQTSKDVLKSVIIKAFKSLISKSHTLIDEEDNRQLTDESIETNALEAEACGIITDILKWHIDMNRITFKNYKKYIAVSINEKWYWICRLQLKTGKMSIVLPAHNYSGSSHYIIDISSPSDIIKYSGKILEALEMSKDFYNKFNKDNI